MSAPVSSGLSRLVVAIGLVTTVALLYLALAGSAPATFSSSPAPPPAAAPEHTAHLADRVGTLEKNEADRTMRDQELAQLREKVAKLEVDALQRAGEWAEHERELEQLRAAVAQLVQDQEDGEGDDDVAMPPECQAMWMADVDKKAFVRALASRKVDQYIEWGGGGSTLCSSRLVAHVTTIEHNEAWCASLREQLKSNNVTNVNLVCSPVAWTSFGDTPEGDGTYEQFQDYVNAVDTLGIAHFDVVFIDGRARVACAKKAQSYVSRSSVVLVHDWKRDHYHTMKEWYDLVDTPRGQLALLQKKPT